MFTLLGSVLGFLTALAPKLIGLWNDRQDRKHELAMMDAQSVIQERLGEQKIEAMGVDADIRDMESVREHDQTLMRQASGFVVNLAASVRPVITYAFFIEFVALSLALMFGWMEPYQYEVIWDEDMKAIFAAIMSFWFSSRTLNRQGHS